MDNITVTCKKVRGGYVATATDGRKTTTNIVPHPEPKYAKRIVERLFRDGTFDSIIPYPLDENEMSGGSWVEFPDSDIEVKSQCTSRPDSFFNSYWFAVVTVLVFLGAIFLTNSCLGL